MKIKLTGFSMDYSSVSTRHKQMHVFKFLKVAGTDLHCFAVCRLTKRSFDAKHLFIFLKSSLFLSYKKVGPETAKSLHIPCAQSMSATGRPSE